MSRERPCVAPALPPGLAEAVAGYAFAHDTVGESGAAVYRLGAQDRPTLFLKHGRGACADDVADEFARIRWLATRAPVPGVRAFAAAGDEAWLVTEALPGRTAWQSLEEGDDAAELVDGIAALLARLHALPPAECPFNAAHPLRLAHARVRMAAGEVDATDFGEDHRGWTPERVWDEMMGLLPDGRDPVVTHGDYSLDNILVADGRVVGMIDLGRVGLADRYQDLAILWDSLGEFGTELRDRMWRAYGIERPDMDRVRFHLCLDEFF